jgi:hypothetical protein
MGVPVTIVTMQLRRVIYCSTASAAMRLQDMYDMLAQAQLNNFERGVTGVLVFDNHYFLFATEGLINTVEILLSRIRVDPRHDQLKLIEDTLIPERKWQGWGMALAMRDLTTETIFQRYFLNKIFNPYKLSALNALDLLVDLTKLEEAPLAY